MNFRLILSLAAFLLAATAARAEQSRTDWSDPYQHAELRVSPMALIFGIYGADASVRITEYFSVGGGYEEYQYSTTTRSSRAHQFSLTSTIYPWGRETSGNYFVRPLFGFIPTTVQDLTGVNPTRTVNQYAAGLSLGRQWMWSTGLNTTLGVGFVYHWNAGSQTVAQVSQVEPLFEWSIGWAF